MAPSCFQRTLFSVERKMGLRILGILLWALPLGLTALPARAAIEPSSPFLITDKGGSPVAASDRRGRFLLVWADTRLGLVGQRFNAAGARVGGMMVLSPEGGGYPRVAMDVAGRFVVTWTYQKTGQYCVGGRRFAENGRLLGRLSLDYCTTVLDDPPVTSVSAAPDGRFVVAWGQTFPGEEWGHVFVRRFAANGQPIGNPIVVSRPNEEKIWWLKPAVAMDAAGNFTVAWGAWDSEAWTSPEVVFVRSFNAQGKVRNAGFRQKPQGFGNFSGVCAVASGAKTAVVWEDREGNWQDSVWVGRILGPNGGPGGPAIRIDTRYEVHGYAGEFAAAMDAGGRLALVFEGDIFDDPGVGVNGEIFDATGRSLGTIPISSDTGSGTEWYWAGSPAVAFADGVLLTAWVEQWNGVKAQFFRVR